MSNAREAIIQVAYYEIAAEQSLTVEMVGNHQARVPAHWREAAERRAKPYLDILEKAQQEAQQPWINLEGQLQAGEASDGHHTHNELYAYRLAYNALYFNTLATSASGNVSKSWRHHDGEPCFGVTEEGRRWSIVTADIFGGQVSNHYREEHWDLFKVPEVENAPEWDGHTPAVALERLLETAREVGW